MSPQTGNVRDAAETIALRALAFLAGDNERLGRFLALTGIGPDELRTQAREPHILAGVLDHLMQDETLLLVFSADAGVKPETIAAAYFALAGPQTDGSF
jgi:hypothetical protein